MHSFPHIHIYKIYKLKSSGLFYKPLLSSHVFLLIPVPDCFSYPSLPLMFLSCFLLIPIPNCFSYPSSPYTFFTIPSSWLFFVPVLSCHVFINPSSGLFFVPFLSSHIFLLIPVLDCFSHPSSPLIFFTNLTFFVFVWHEGRQIPAATAQGSSGRRPQRF